MTNEENGTTQQPSEQAPNPSADANGAVAGGASAGLVAGPLRMTIAGLLVGLIAWQILHWNHPFFEVPETPVENERSPTDDELLQEKIAVMETDRKEAVVFGLIVGGLAALVFALVEGISQGGVGRTLVITSVAIVLGAGLGAVGGYLSVSFQYAYEFDESLQPMTRTFGTQGIFWLLTASGIGLGVALFAGRVSLVLGVLLQTFLASVLFVIIYVPLAALLFATDNAERMIPFSSGNMAVWAIGAFGLMGLMIGLSRLRAKKATDGPSD